MIGEFFPQSNLVRLYHLEGNSNDSSGNGDNGTDTSMTYGNSYGKIKQGAYFNGSAYITLGTGINPSNTFTILCWVKLQDQNRRQLIESPNAYAGWSTNAVSYGYVGFYDAYSWFSNAQYWLSNISTSSLTTGVWGLMAMSYNSSTDKCRFYFVEKGKFLDSGDVSKTVVGSGQRSGQNLKIIGAIEIGQKFYGNMDEFVVFNRVLTPSEIRKWYAWSVGKLL